ncbi:MAG: hypothetical protein ACYDIC_01975 [Desulfobaccales bacterium]
MNTRVWKKTLGLMSVILLSWGYLPGLAQAADSPKPFTDPRGYFSFTPPPGWAEKDFPGEKVGRIRFTAPDSKATLSIIVMPASPQEVTYEQLLAAKRQVVEKMRREKPDGKYRLAEGAVCQFKCVKIEVEFPGQLIQENDLFVEKGLSVSFGYAAADRGSLEKFRQVAADSFCTIKLKGK